MIARGSAIVMLFGIALAAGTAAGAQPAAKSEQPSNAMQGIQLNRDQPVKIEANTLEVRDKQRQATFIGKVKLTQGDMVLNCDSLVIFYEDTSAAPPTAQKKGAPPAATAGPGLGGGNQQIKRAEAKGNVLVTQKDQTAKGDNGVFDVKSNNITLIGSVVVTQGTNVLRGDRMVVDLNTGVARVEFEQVPAGRGPVQSVRRPATGRRTCARAAPCESAPCDEIIVRPGPGREILARRSDADQLGRSLCSIS